MYYTDIFYNFAALVPGNVFTAHELWVWTFLMARQVLASKNLIALQNADIWSLNAPKPLTDVVFNM